MLVAPAWLKCGGGLSWSKMTSSSIIGLNADGDVVEGSDVGSPDRTAATIHLGLRKIRPDAK